jgi:hypothetical protein
MLEKVEQGGVNFINCIIDYSGTGFVRSCSSDEILRFLGSQAFCFGYLILCE